MTKKLAIPSLVAQKRSMELVAPSAAKPLHRPKGAPLSAPGRPRGVTGCRSRPTSAVGRVRRRGRSSVASVRSDGATPTEPEPAPDLVVVLLDRAVEQRGRERDEQHDARGGRGARGDDHRIEADVRRPGRDHRRSGARCRWHGRGREGRRRRTGRRHAEALQGKPRQSGQGRIDGRGRVGGIQPARQAACIEIQRVRTDPLQRVGLIAQVGHRGHGGGRRSRGILDRLAPRLQGLGDRCARAGWSTDSPTRAAPPAWANWHATDRRDRVQLPGQSPPTTRLTSVSVSSWSADGWTGVGVGMAVGVGPGVGVGAGVGA